MYPDVSGKREPAVEHAFLTLRPYVVFRLQKIEKPFLDAVERTLDDRYSENVENIYKLTIKFIIETLIDGFDKAQSDKAKS